MDVTTFVCGGKLLDPSVKRDAHRMIVLCLLPTTESILLNFSQEKENKMYKNLAIMGFASSLIVGCASVPMESAAMSDLAKTFNSPSNGNAALYIYRSGSFGGAIKKDVWVDGKCIGETAPNVFFYEEVEGGTQHKVSTESEFSPNDLLVNTESGKNYFVQQFMKMGVFVGGAGVELVDEEEGKKAVQDLKLATKGSCSR